MDEMLYLKEHTTHGEKNSPIGVYRNCTDNGYSISRHWHDEEEFIYLDQGSMVFYLDAVPIELNAGEAIYIESGRLHSGQVQSLHAIFYSIVFHMSIFHNDLVG